MKQTFDEILKCIGLEKFRVGNELFNVAFGGARFGSIQGLFRRAGLSARRSIRGDKRVERAKQAGRLRSQRNLLANQFDFLIGIEKVIRFD